MKRKRILAFLLSAAMVISGMTVAFAESDGTGSNEDAAISGNSAFQQELESKYIDPDRVYSTDTRWWLGMASATDETLLEEIQNLYDGGFRGVELCMQSASGANAQTYAYGSEMWSHKWKLMMNKILDLGMGVYLTSGTHWATSNVPNSDLDPDSQEAMQMLVLTKTEVTVTDPAAANVTILTRSGTRRDAGKFVGAYAYKVVEKGTKVRNGTNVTNVPFVDYESGIDLTDTTKATIADGETAYDKTITWTAPDAGNYIIYGYWTHGAWASSSPSIEASYATNYFDVRGVDALRKFWEKNYLSDPELNKKILDGDVQLFMDSLELSATAGGGFTWWAEDMREEFQARKGYDILPYIFLAQDLPQVQAVYNPYMQPAEGFGNDLYGAPELREKIINDWVDVLTQMYCEKMLVPLKEWLNSVGIKTRAQISYGRSFEITEPSMYVDYPEAEGFNQYNNVDIFRLHTAGSKLQNKVLSTEAGTALYYGAHHQMNYKDAYEYYAAGFQRMIWHIWGTEYGYGNNVAWPGYQAGSSGFQRFGNRYPSSADWDEFNGHLGRIQQLMQTGKSRTDIGFVHNNWNQGLRFGGSKSLGGGNAAGLTNFQAMNWMQAHMGVYYRSTELQDNGYTYDYFSPKMLLNEDVYFDEETKTIELAGYKALVLYQDWLDIAGARKILEYAGKGLPVVIIDGAAVRTTFNDGKDAELADIITALKALPTVRTAQINDATAGFNYFKPIAEGYDDNVMEKLQELGVYPYAGFDENHQLITQSRQDEDGNRYLYVYNYCDGGYHQNSFLDHIKTENHGTNIQTEIKMDGKFVPYSIDAWSGKVTELANYRYENGQTVFDIDLDYANIALYAFEAVEDEKLHIISTDADSAYATANGLVVRTTKTGLYDTILSNGDSYVNSIKVPEAYDITDWDLTVESWTPNATAGDLVREETFYDVKVWSVADQKFNIVPELTTRNTKTSTVKTDIDVKLDKLTTWNNIPEIGQAVSGRGHYEATFNWDVGTADGAYLDFGEKLIDSMKVWINGKKVGGDVSTNPTKVQKSIGEKIDGEIPDGGILYSGGVSLTKPIADISEYLVDGENTIVIEYNSGLTNVMIDKRIITASGANPSRGWYSYWIKYLNYGPEQAKIIPFVEEEISLSDDMPLKLTTAAHLVKAGDYFNVNASFKEKQPSNAIVLNYTFDGDKFEYANYTPAAGVSVVDAQYGDGYAKITLMIRGYDAENLGDIMLRAKEDAKLSKERQGVWVTADYVLKDSAGDKTVNTAKAGTSFTTLGDGTGEPAVPGDTNNDRVIDIIDLSNMIDWFGTKSNNAEWNSLYTFFDFNNNGVIDIYDIGYVARLIA